MKSKAKERLMKNHSTQGRFYTDYEINQMKLRWTKQAFKLSIHFSIMALKDQFGFGKVRMARYLDKTMDVFDSYDREYIDMADIQYMVKEETGIELQ